jgi:ribosome maturation factor RimP
MIDIVLVKEIIEQHINDTELFLVEMTVSENNIINIILDSETNVSIGDCISLSKHIESKLDRDVEDYELQVSSSGVGQPLRLERQFAKNIERTVEVLDNKGIKHSGTLKTYDQESVGVEITRNIKLEGKKRKELVTNIENFRFDQIKSVVVVPDLGRKK